jgi:Ca2+-binding EF-hand superfamily protein
VRPEELFDKLDMDNRGSLTYVQLQEGLEHVLKLRCRGNTFHDITYALDPERRYQVSRADFQREFAPSVASMYSSSSSSSAPSGNSHLHVPASPAYGSTSNSSAVGSDELEPLSTTDRNALYSKIVRRFADVPLAEVRRQMMAFEDSHNPGSISCPNLKRALTKYADDFPLMDVVTELYGRAVQAVLVDDVLNLIEEALRHRKREGKHIVAGASPMKSPTAFSGTSSGTASVPRSPAASFGGNVSTVARQVLEQVGFIKQQCRKADRGGEGVIARHVFRMNVRKAGVTADDADIDELSVALADGAGNIAYDKMEAQLQRLA